MAAAGRGEGDQGVPRYDLALNLFVDILNFSNCAEWSWWLLLFPAHLLFFLTIPDVRKGPW